MLGSTRHLRVLPTSLVLLLVFTSQCLASPDPIAKAEPEALPIPAPIPEAAPLPAPIAAPAPLPAAEPEAKAEAEPGDGGSGNVYQFSGAIYINGNGGGYQSQGGSYQSASPAQCPSSAPISCTNLGEPDWCCPSGNTCGWASNQVVGCCPSGESCSGTVGGYNQGGPTTSVYYSSWQPTTTYYSNPGTTVYVGGPTTNYYNPGTATVYNGYCSTIVASGPGLPTTAAGPCGTVLVISGAEAILRVSLISTVGLVLGGLLVTWRMGGWG